MVYVRKANKKWKLVHERNGTTVEGGFDSYGAARKEQKKRNSRLRKRQSPGG